MKKKIRPRRWTPFLFQMRRKVGSNICILFHFYTEFYLRKFTTFILLVEQKDEKESGKIEEPAKLQNGDGGKDGVAAGASEEKKKAKTRFMFNIADGGFTGKKDDQIISLVHVTFFFCCCFLLVYLLHDVLQSCTPCGRMKSEQPL